MGRRRVSPLLGLVVVMSLVVAVPPAAVAEVLGGAPAKAGAAPPLTSPEQGVPESLDGLQYGDPSAGIDLVEEPATDSYGAAQLRHPIDLPAGRLAWQPQIQLAYSSDGENDWLGEGWDLSLDAIKVPGLGSDVSADSIEVDTRWGVPRYRPGAETETYLFGGEQLAPNAHRFPDPPISPRVTDRVYTKRVEGDFLRIIRHGDNPKDYWWEVHDKLGNKYFYGGVLDDVPGNAGYTGVGHQVEDAVLTSKDGNVYWWGLTEKWDISSNVVSYFYKKQVGDTGVTNGNGEPQADAPQGTELYLERINYTGSRLRGEFVPDGAEPLPRYGPYDVNFVRASTLGEPRRPDASIDASHGGLEVTADLLRQIEVTYTPVGSQDAQTVRQYDLNYEVGPFGKSLLTSVTKSDSEGNELSTNSFDYYDDAHDGNGDPAGFGPEENWHPAGEAGDDGLSREFLGVNNGSALGGTETIGGGGRLFLGASLFSPDKLLAVGGGIQLAGADGKTNIEFIDINGDNLPDKVWQRPNCDNAGASVCYRLNTARPDTPTDETRFGDVLGVDGLLTHLSEDTEFSVGGGPEAYVGASIMYNHTWTFSRQTSYFTDVNADGLPDLVRDGDVLFNHLVSRNPDRLHFDKNSGTTEVPIEQDNKLSTSIVPTHPEVEQEQQGQFPRQDTVRRWVAPANGDIEITAPVRLSAASDDPEADGVRVAIQHNGTEIWTSDIGAGDTTEHVPTGVDNIHVQSGDRIYFRVGSKDNGADDRVTWDPTIQYRGQGERLDANGKDVYRYTGSDDFTLAGMNGSVISMPYDGRIRVTGDIVKTKPTSDDIHVQLLRNGTVVQEMCIRGSADGPPQNDCNASPSDPDTGSFPFDAEVDVVGRHKDAAGDVVPGDKISLRLSVDSNIDPDALRWKPELRYLSATDEDGSPLPVTDPDGNPTMVLKAPYDADLYPNTDITLPQGTDDEDDVLLRFEVDRDDIPALAFPAKVTFTAKTDDGVLRFKHTFTIPAGDGVYHYPAPCDPITGSCPSDDFHWEGFGGSHETFYDFTFTDAAVGRATNVFVNGGTTPAAKWWPGTRVVNNEADVFPPPYRGWGYAGYKADGQRAVLPIDEADLAIKLEDLPDPNDPPESADDPDFNNPIKGGSYPFGPLPANGLWIGPKFDDSQPDADPTNQVPCAWPFSGCLAPRGTWGGPDQASSSLLGGDEPGALKPNQIVTGDAYAPVLYAKADQDSLGVDLLGLGGGASSGKSTSVVDFLDMNADGYPDAVTEHGVVYTNENGGLTEDLVDLDLQDGVRVHHEIAGQAGAGGSPAAISTGSDGKGAGAGGTKGSSGPGGAKGVGKGGGKSKKSKAGKMLGNLAKSMGLGGELGLQSTNHQDDPHADCVSGADCDIQTDLADLNGDGLPDRVRVTDEGDIYVRWNLGYGFTPGDEEALWAKATLDEGSSTSTGLDAGLGFGTGLLDFSGGVSLSKVDERTEAAWTDLNGDGLDDLLLAEIDQVTGDSDGVEVRLNTGTGLAERSSFGAFIEGQIARTECAGIGGGGDFTIAIPIFEIYYILINPGFNVDKGNCSPINDLVDVNGDGNPDSVSSSDDGDLSVRPNTTGRTNLLKTVHRPLGGRIDLDYTRAGNTPDHPSSVYVLSKVVIDDGHPGDGADQQVTTYQYEGAKESFAEREDYGFRRVIEEDRDPATNTVYRSWERIYHNTNYYNRGLLQSETLRDGNGTPFTSMRTTYEMVDSDDGGPANEASLTGSVFPRLTTVVQNWHDGSGAVAKTTQMDYAYDERGNLVTVSDLGEPGTTDDDVTAEMTYPDCRPVASDPDADPYPWLATEYPWTQAPANSLIVRSGSTILQRRESDVGCDTASVAEVRDYLDPTSDDPGQIAVTNVCYLPVGGQTSAVIGPSKTGVIGSEPCGGDGYPDDPGPGRYTIEYSYDDPDRLGAFVTETVDSYEMTSTSTYDNRFGRLVSTTDPVGAETSYTYDVANRVETVTGPLEQGTGNATIAYEYHPNAQVPWALAKHIDTANPGTTIDTVAFSDGLARLIQTKRDATLFQGSAATPQDRMIVADQVAFDAFGRPVKEFYERDEPLGTPGTFHDTYDVDHVTETTYDVLDRETAIEEPGDRVTELTYGFDDGPFAGPMFTAFEEGPGATRSRTYSNVRGDIVGEEQLHTVGGVDQPLLTTYTYDPLQRLARSVDPTGAATDVTYDLLGRRTAIDNPDTGLVEFEYDLASNIVSKQTPNLRRTNQRIRYLYDDFITLEQVRYPRNPANNVRYVYGGPGEAENGAGMLIEVEDGSRTTTIGYDLLGNPIRETDTMKVPGLDPFNLPKHTFTTRRTYDTWGRELEMTYPDGEVLTTGYDSGGLARSISGTKGGNTQTYVKRAEYDRFGNRRFMEYGNGLTTLTSYDADTLWFADQLVKKGTAIWSDLHYKYDAAGNVLQRNDTRPAPASSALSGPSSQTFTYDDLNRLTSASGRYTDSYRRVRTYALDLTYDADGRVARKAQVDVLAGQPRAATTFDLSYQYNATQPHAPSRIGNVTNTWDADGNLTGWTDPGGPKRAMVWDEEDRIRSSTDNSALTTTYKYDYEHELSISSGAAPLGDTEFVNDEYTVMEGIPWKTYYLDDEPVATTRVFAGGGDVPMYYFTNDLIGSPYLLTDQVKVLEHTLVLPSGQPWVEESPSSLKRARFQFAEGYYDQPKALYNLGERWYDPRGGFFYSADPILVDDLEEAVDDPMLLNAFSYAEDNPTSYVDETGNQRVSAQLDQRLTALGAQVVVAGSNLRLDASQAYNSPEFKAFRDKYVSRVFSEADPDNKRRQRVETVLGFLAGPPLFELTLAENGSFTLAETDFKVAGVGFRDVAKLFKKKKPAKTKSP